MQPKDQVKVNMAPSSVTCPHCQAIFRITHAQLNAASGSVRCGSCLEVFNAMDQVSRPKENEALSASIDTVEAPPHQEEASPSPPSGQPTQETLIVQQHKPVKKTGSLQPGKPGPTELDPSVKAKIATAPMEYDGYHQQRIETLIQELDQRETEKTINEQQRRRKRTWWGVVSCALTVTLALQFAWFNRHTLSLNPALRPTYVMACNLLSCTLPPLVNINAIRSIDLLVRSHPDHSNALQVDAVIINEASHPQPFPDLTLTFTDIHGRLVANRTFSPSEYLGGELAGSEQMPKAQPIRLGLAILDPGDRAVNYQLTFKTGQRD